MDRPYVLEKRLLLDPQSVNRRTAWSLFQTETKGFLKEEI